MVASHSRRRLGFAMLGVIAAVCLLSDVLIWWLDELSSGFQPHRTPFEIDLQILSCAVWGIVLIQPAILSVYLAFARHHSVIRIIVAAVVLMLVFTSGEFNGFFLSLWLLVMVSLSLKMWGTRISGGWQLFGNEDSLERNVAPVAKSETIFEATTLIVLSIAVMIAAAWFNKNGSLEGVLIVFCLFGLFGVLILAPVVFVSLRSKNLAAVVPALILPVIGLPATMFGFEWFMAWLNNSPMSGEAFGSLLVAFFAAVMLAVTLVAIRLAGYRLHKRPFEKNLVAKTPVDPFSD
jgi:hypothetical protein